MDETFDMLELMELEPEAGLGGLSASFVSFIDARVKLARDWDAFFDQLLVFQKRLEPFTAVTPAFLQFETFRDDRHFAGGAVALLRLAAQISSFYRKRAIKESAKLAYLLGDIEKWADQQLGSLEKFIWDPTAGTLDSSEELGHLLARLKKLNRVLEKFDQPELVSFCKTNERLAEALSHYVAETRSSSINIFTDSVVGVVESLEPKIETIRSHAAELQAAYNPSHAVYMVLMEVVRHMDESKVMFQRLKWLRPK